METGLNGVADRLCPPWPSRLMMISEKTSTAR